MIVGNIFSGDYVKIHSFIKEAKYNVEGIKFFHRILQEFDIIPPGDRILDCCCGQGQDMKYLRTFGYIVDGLDASKDMLECARKDNPGAELILSKAEELSEYDKYAVVYCLVTFGMLEDQKIVCGHIARALKLSGLFIFDYWNSDAFLRGKFEYDEDIGIKRHVTRVVNNGKCDTKYYYPSENLTIEHSVKLFTLWEIKSILLPWFDIELAFAGYSPVSPNWTEDKYITIVAKLRNNG